jgi:hypothetical protein
LKVASDYKDAIYSDRRISKMSDPNDYAAAQQQMAVAQHIKECNEITEVGRETFGTAVFDEAAETVVGELGPEKTAQFMALARGFDKPAEVIKHLSDNPSRLKQLAKLNAERQAIEIARIESQLAPHGHTDTGSNPAWKLPSARGGRVSDEEWHRGGDNLSDAAWHREFDRRTKERGGRPLVSREAERAMERARRGR